MQKHELQAQLEETQSQYLAAIEQRNQLLLQANQLADKASTLGGERWRYHDEELEAHEKKIDGLHDQAHQLRLEASAKEKESGALNHEIIRLQHAIDTAIDYYGTSEADLARHRVDIETIEAECATIRGKIDELSAIEPGTAAALVQTLRDQRKPLAAQVALGEAGAGDLDALDARIADAERQAREEAAAQAGRTDALAGLNDRLGTAEARLRAAQAAQKTASLDFLRGEAESAAKLYRKKAEALIEIYRRVVAYDALFRAKDETPLLAEQLSLSVPWLRSQAFPERPYGADAPWFYLASMDSGLHGIQESVKADLANRGVVI